MRETVTGFILFEVLKNIEKKMGFETEVKWKKVIYVFGFHIFGICWSYLYAFPVKWQTLLFAYLTFMFAGTGIVAGVHRLWTHRSFKATLLLRIYLMLGFACSGQNSIYNWVLTHRLHHKYSDTDADPHNVNRGFFYSHIGWLIMKKKDIVKQKERSIDMSDIEKDAVAAFHRKHVVMLNVLCCFILPTATGILLWNEDWKCAVAWQCFIRYVLLFHAELTINSVAHMFGSRPYMKPTYNFWVVLYTGGEGNHNYHHSFPYDYKSGETMDLFNLCSLVIRTWAELGLAYDLKEASPQLVQAVLNSQNAKYIHCVDD